jgi:hypothetical protein
MTFECDCEEDYGYCDCEDYDDRCYCSDTEITRNLSLNLKKGWNAITQKEEWNENTNTITITITIGDSSRARWFLDEWGGYSMSISNYSENLESVKLNRDNARSLFRSKRW